MALDTWLALIILFGAGGLTPGPAVMLVLGTSFQRGFRAALLPALGVASANIVWLVLAASGAAAILTQFPTAFTALKAVGLLVIIYLALSTMFGPLPDTMALSKDQLNTVSLNKGPLIRTHQNRPLKLYAKGVALQLSSPMPLVYFGMLLPAFFDLDRPIMPQFLIMLITITLTEMVGLSIYAYAAEPLRRQLRSPRAARTFNLCIGLVMILSGLWAIIGLK